MYLSKWNWKINNKTPIYLQIIFVLVMLWLRDVMHFPSAITYVTDVLLVMILFFNVFQKSKVRIFKDVVPQYVIVVGIVICMLLGAIINVVDPLLVLWGMRNNLRFFLFFFVCINILDKTDVLNIIKGFKIFFWINTLMCTIQFFLFGLKGDFLGGFFGVSRGCNGYLNVFLCIICAIIIADYFATKSNIYGLFLYLAATLYVAILAELKVFYIELIIMIAFVIIMSKPSLKTVLISIAFVVSFIVGAVVLFIYDPKSFGVLFDADILEFYVTGNGYTNSGDLNRFTAVEQIYTQFFEGDYFRSLFGFGLGNCEYSQFDFLQSDFSKAYGRLNYRWFTHAWVYLEQGFIGLTMLISFFVSIIMYAGKKMVTENRYYMTIAVVFVPTCILGIMYNSSIQVENCYVIAFMCAIPYIVNKTFAMVTADE